jgi:hypothetical protein
MLGSGRGYTFFVAREFNYSFKSPSEVYPAPLAEVFANCKVLRPHGPLLVSQAWRHLAQQFLGAGWAVSSRARTMRPHNASRSPFAPAASGFLAT